MTIPTAAWPEYDLAPCVRDGEHHQSQRHVLAECPTNGGREPAELDGLAPIRRLSAPTADLLDLAPAGQPRFGEDPSAAGVARDNLRRAQLAGSAVRHMAELTGTEADSPDVAIGDLLANLRHLADSLWGEDGAQRLASLDRMAQDTYAAERRGE